MTSEPDGSSFWGIGNGAIEAKRVGGWAIEGVSGCERPGFSRDQNCEQSLAWLGGLARNIRNSRRFDSAKRQGRQRLGLRRSFEKITLD